MPPRTYATVLRCIDARFNCLPYYDTVESKESHLYFVQRLEEIADLLAPTANSIDSSTVKPSQRPEKRPRKSTTKVKKEGNAFSLLSIQEVKVNDDAHEGPISLPTNTKVAGKLVNLKFEIQETKEDGLVQFRMLFKDVMAMRKYLGQVWQDYKERKADLTTAAVTTNMAFELMDQAVSELWKDFEASFDGSFLNVQKALVSSALRQTTGRHLNHLPRASDLEDDQLQDLYDQYFVAVSQYLLGHDELVNEGDSLYKRLKVSSRYDPNRSWHRMAYPERIKQDKALLSDLFGEEAGVSSHFPGADPMDDMLRAHTSDFIHNWGQILTPLLVFEAQVFLDMNHILGRDTERALTEVKAEMQKIWLGVNRLLDLNETTGCQPDNLDESYGLYPKAVELGHLARPWIGNVSQSRPINCISPCEKKVVKGEASCVLKRNPIALGLILHSALILYQRVMLSSCNVYGSHFASVQLYACSQLDEGDGVGIKRPSWPEVERFMDVCGRNELFAGRYPTDLESAFTSSLLITGLPLKDVLLAKRGGYSSRSPDKMRLRQIGAPSDMLSRFHKRHSVCPCAPCATNWTKELSEIASEANAKAKPQVPRRKKRSKKRKGGSTREDGGEKETRCLGWLMPSDEKELGLVGIVKTLSRMMEEEVELLHLDYLPLHEVGLMCLDKLRFELMEPGCDQVFLPENMFMGMNVLLEHARAFGNSRCKCCKKLGRGVPLLGTVRQKLVETIVEMRRRQRGRGRGQRGSEPEPWKHRYQGEIFDGLPSLRRKPGGAEEGRARYNPVRSEIKTF